MAFDGIQITNRGRNLLAKAEAGLTKITYTKFSAGDGKLAGQMPVALKALISEKISFPVSRLKIQSENVVVPGFEFSNQGVASGFFFREVGLWATDPDLGEILYAYANSGEGAEYIDAQNTSAVLKKLFNFELTVSNTAQVTVVVDDSIIYATPQDVADALKESKEYTDAAILGVKVPDASTTQKGIVQLDNTYTSNSVTTAPTSRALTTAFNAATTGIYKERGNVPADWNTATSSGSYTVSLASWTGYSNYPANSYSYGKLSVFAGAGARVQVYYTHDNPSRTFWRVGFNDTDWRAWTQIVRTGQNAFTDDSIVFTTPVPLILKRPGIKSWVMHMSDNGRVYISPSNTPDATDWNFGNGLWIEEGNVGWQGGDLNSLKQSASDVKTNVANAITGKGGTANSGMTGAQLAAAITNLPVKRWAKGTFNGQSATSPSTTTGASMNVGVNTMNFLPTRVFIRLRLKDTYGNLYIEGIAMAGIPYDNDVTLYGRFQNRISIYSISQSPGGFSATINSTEIRDYAGGGSIAVIEAFEWFAYE
ncbi:phage tail protein [Paenibacillus jamilae]|uniref:phage tail-collar fiber domain-containing protein n=1 Tax=Paenibacillus jamilae TaxID=114136 RepID=UPI003D2D36BA